MPYCVQIDSPLSRPEERQLHMEHENETENETDAELVTETLVEEVSIDGMCGVY
jgi:mycofactocin precursor peptide MftA